MRARRPSAIRGLNWCARWRRAGIEIIAVPGPCAAIAALSIGALPTDRFCFEGFLPARGAAAAHRLKSLASRAAHAGDLRIAAPRARDAGGLREPRSAKMRAATVVREATKLHETTYRGSLRELLDAIQHGCGFLARRNRSADRRRAANAMPTRRASEAKARLDKVLIALLGRVAAETSRAPRGADHRRARQRGLQARAVAQRAIRLALAPGPAYGAHRSRPDSRCVLSAHGGKSGLHRARCQVTPGRREPTESATERYRLSAAQAAPVRVKWCGKSAPRGWQHQRHGKPHLEQDQIGKRAA